MYRITRRLVGDLDNNMAAVHPQPVQDSLPPGWECRYDPRTGRYYFLNHLEHITTWEDPRLRLSEIQQAYPPYSNTTVQYPSDVSPPPPPPGPMPAPLPTTVTNQEGSVQVDERILMKLCVQFPTVEEGHIWQLLKQYHNRENVVVSALLAEGSPRAQTHTVDLTPKLQKAEIQSFQVDEALYFKLRNFFPTADPDYIRNLQKVYNNQEHEVIAALVAGNRAGNRQSPHPSSPKMKLRYLKLVFPECDEAVLFDVLNNCDNNAQEASNRLIGMGYSKRDTPITRPNISQPFHRPVTEIPRPILTPERPPVFILPNASDKLQLVSRLQEQFPAISRTLVNMALDSSNYNEDRAKQFLAAMTPQDGVRPSIPHVEGKDAGTEGGPLIAGFPSEAPPVPPRSRHASASQDSDSSRHSSLERHSLRGESSREATPSKSPSHRASYSSPARSISSPARKVSTTTTTDRTFRQKFKREILKFSKSTSTQEEYEILSKYRTRPKGPDPTLRKGPCEKLLLKDYMPWVGPDPKNHKGPDASLRRGPDPSNVGPKREYRAKGPQREYCRGSVVGIHNSKLSTAPTSNGNIEIEHSRCS